METAVTELKVKCLNAVALSLVLTALSVSGQTQSQTQEHDHSAHAADSTDHSTHQEFIATPAADDPHAGHGSADPHAGHLSSPAQTVPAEHAEHAGHSGHSGHEGHEMQFDSDGMVMNSNLDRLPLNCAAISEDVEFTVYGGTRYAKEFAQRTFAYSQHEFEVPPCSRVKINFVNDDQVRHQWMLHGLPRYLYPQGMFHLEAAGGKTVSGSFIVPADDATYLVHCDITQHMEKGMKAQLVVGKGAGNLWSVPGVSQNFLIPRQVPIAALILIAAGLMIAAGLSAIMISVKKQVDR